MGYWTAHTSHAHWRASRSAARRPDRAGLTRVPLVRRRADRLRRRCGLCCCRRYLQVHLLADATADRSLLLAKLAALLLVCQLPPLRHPHPQRDRHRPAHPAVHPQAQPLPLAHPSVHVLGGRALVPDHLPVDLWLAALHPDHNRTVPTVGLRLSVLHLPAGLGLRLPRLSRADLYLTLAACRTGTGFPSALPRPCPDRRAALPL